ncbi:RICIN domain-containing protein [Streptomyces sp. NBC_00094]|nr:RICIN domain-containing protein [Streptomyces sp. NBC_00094]
MPSAGSVTVTPPAQYDVFQLINRNSGRAIDVPNASTSAGTVLIQYTPSSSANQQFRFIPVGGGLYEISTTHGGTPLAWDIGGGSSADGAPLLQWHTSHATNQQWEITDTGDGHVVITCARSGKVLGVTGDSTADLATIEQQTADGGTGQQWRRIGH